MSVGWSRQMEWLMSAISNNCWHVRSSHGYHPLSTSGKIEKSCQLYHCISDATKSGVFLLSVCGRWNAACLVSMAVVAHRKRNSPDWKNKLPKSKRKMRKLFQTLLGVSCYSFIDLVNYEWKEGDFCRVLKGFSSSINLRVLRVFNLK